MGRGALGTFAGKRTRKSQGEHGPPVAAAPLDDSWNQKAGSNKRLGAAKGRGGERLLQEAAKTQDVDLLDMSELG